MRAGTIAAQLFNVQRRKRSDRIFTWRDFFQSITAQRKKPKTLADLQSMARAALKAIKER